VAVLVTEGVIQLDVLAVLVTEGVIQPDNLAVPVPAKDKQGMQSLLVDIPANLSCGN
jgi:hypothetical protein